VSSSNRYEIDYAPGVHESKSELQVDENCAISTGSRATRDNETYRKNLTFVTDPLKDDTGGRTTLEILEDVCDAWKTITSSTPELWTIISVKFHAGTKKHDVEQAFNSTKLFLQRSGILPLLISIIDRYRSPSSDCASLLRLIAEHSKRWRYVHFEMPMRSHRLIN
jgi:hypothetical protein